MDAGAGVGVGTWPSNFMHHIDFEIQLLPATATLCFWTCEQGPSLPTEVPQDDQNLCGYIQQPASTAGLLEGQHFAQEAI